MLGRPRRYAAPQVPVLLDEPGTSITNRDDVLKSTTVGYGLVPVDRFETIKKRAILKFLMRSHSLVLMT